MCYQKNLGEKMNNKDWWQMVSELADWIDTRVLAEDLLGALEIGYEKHDIKNGITLDMLKKFYLYLLGDFDDHAKYFVEIKKDFGELEEKP